MGKILPKIDVTGDITKKDLTLIVNGTVVQQSSVSNMIWSIPEIISILSKSVQLEEGDLIFTGTPAGVGSIKSGDVLEAHCTDLPSCNFKVICDQPNQTCKE